MSIWRSLNHHYKPNLNLESTGLPAGATKLLSQSHSGHGLKHAMEFTRDYNILLYAPVEEFAQYVTQNHLKGRQGDDTNAKFISRSALEKYWTLDKVKTILLACQPPIFQYATQIIEGGFICVFSILVFIGFPAAISKFTEKGLDDHRLPFAATPPDIWPTHPPYVKIYNKFRKHQWAFTPLEFQNGNIHKRTIDPQTILPVEYEAKLGRNSGANDVAVIWKVKIYDECKGYIPMGTVVFKVYNKSDKTARDIFSSEADVYTLLPSDYDKYIVKCHGSFEQGDKSIIILEYAPGGSLLDFFERTRLPTLDEIKTLWAELFKLLNALYMIHEMEVPADCSNLVLSGTHHDIQPLNILVFTRDPNSVYDIYFKLADFGTARVFRTLSQIGDTQTGNNDGNRMYTAPESCPVYPVQDQVPKKVNPTVDVWGLGAVFSETFIWSILGEDGRERYRKRRKEENQKFSWMKGSGYDACFHDGTSALQAVTSMHREAMLQTRRIDSLSPAISEVILRHMLQPWKDRLDSMSTLTKANEAITRASEETTPPPTSHWSNDSTLSRTRSSRNKNQISLPQSSFADTGLGISREVSMSGSSSHHSMQTQTIQGVETPETLETEESDVVDGIKNLIVNKPGSLPFARSSYPGGHRPNTLSHAQPTTQTKRSATVSYPPNMSTPIVRLHGNFETSGSGGQYSGERESSETSRNSGDPNPTIQDNSTFFFTSPPLASPISMSDESPESSNQITGRHSIHEPGHGVTPGPAAKPITCKDVYIMLMRKDSQLRNHFRVRSPSEVLKVRGISQALAQITAVKGREQLILIDDFTSMQPDKNNVAETARVISYYVKRADPNKMELYFASDVSTPHLCKTSTDVENIIRKHDFADGACPMGQCLANILNHVWTTFKSSSNPVSIYVMTDGVWETKDDQIDYVIARSATKLAEKKIFPPSIMIQFIRFGQSPVGYRRLKRLDDDLVKTFDLGDYDIVDTKNGDDHVSDILLGSISRVTD